MRVCGRRIRLGGATIVLVGLTITAAACGGGNDTTEDTSGVCDWIDRDLVTRVAGDTGFDARGNLASALDDSLGIADCKVITDFGDKIIAVKYTGFAAGFLTKADSLRTQKQSRQDWRNGGPEIPNDKKKLVPLDNYVFGTAYPTDHYVRTSVITDDEFISVTIFNDADRMSVDLADNIAGSIKHNAGKARQQEHSGN